MNLWSGKLNRTTDLGVLRIIQPELPVYTHGKMPVKLSDKVETREWVRDNSKVGSRAS